MKRRTFVQRSILAAMAVPLVGCSQEEAATGDVASADSVSHGAAGDARLSRIGITTVCFRSRFAQTKTMMAEPTTAPALTLLTAPQFIADELGLHNVEVWDYHFDEKTIPYCEQVRAAAERVGSRISNVQVDDLADLSSPDAAVRAQGVTQAKEWADRTAALGAPSFRVNTGGEEGGTMPLQLTTESFKQIAEYAAQKNVTVLVENHIGYSRNIDNVVALVNAVNHPNCRILTDYGNTPSGGTAERVAALAKLFPKTEFVSAKAVAFDEQLTPATYDYGALVKATEDAGYQGIYSIEMWPEGGASPPADPLRAAQNMKELTLANLRSA